MLRLLSFLVLLLSVADGRAEQQKFAFDHAGVTRGYELYLPAQPRPGQTSALLLVLHGLRGNGQRVARLSGFNEYASRHGFIVVYPDSLGTHWNYLHAIPGAANGPDDPGFLHALVDAISETYPVDIDRRYVAGISNGGFMAQRLACDAQPRFAGFASIAAGGYAVLPASCSRAVPIDALYVHGTADTVVPWNGKEVEDSSGEQQIVALSVSRSLKFWAEHNRCVAPVNVREVPPTGRSQGTRVRVYSSRECADNTEVSLFAVLGGGHNWPGVEGAIAAHIAGRVNLDINASEVVWSFFSRHHAQP